MAIDAKLSLEGRNYDVVECEYEFTQAIKENRLPSGRPGGGLIHITILSPDDTDPAIHSWMKEKTEMKDGKIVFLVVSDSNKTTKKTLTFKDAYCVRLHEYFNKYSSNEMLMRITLNASKIAFGGGGEVEFKSEYFV